MVTIITTVLGVILKIAQIGARVALSRVTVIVTFVATIATTIGAIYSNLSDNTSFLSQAIAKVSQFNLEVSSFVANNEYLQLLGYAFALDTLIDGVISTFIWVFCTLTAAAVTALFGVFVSVLPLLSDLALSALKHQAASAISGLGSK